MPVPIQLPPSNRVGIPEAMSTIIEALKRGSSMSISGLSRKTGIDRRTVGKVVELLLDVQDTLKSKELLKDKMGRSYVIRLREKTSQARGTISSAGKKVKGR